MRTSSYRMLAAISYVLYRFRWVFFQLNVLHRCLPPNLHRFLNELPKTLDETYDQILKRIDEAQRDDAHHLLQCLTVTSRPLRVEEIAELVTFDFRASISGRCHETTAHAARLERGSLVTLIRLVSNARVSREFRLGTLGDFATLPQMKGQTDCVLDEAW